MTVQPQKRLLVQVLSQRWVAETSHEETIDASRMPLEQLAKGSFVPCLIGRHENLVRRSFAHRSLPGYTVAAEKRNARAPVSGESAGPALRPVAAIVSLSRSGVSEPTSDEIPKHPSRGPADERQRNATTKGGAYHA